MTPSKLDCSENAGITRRAMLGGGAASLAMWSAIPRSIAGTRDPRLLTMVLRGGLDGLSLAAPIGDPAYAALRGRIALAKDGPNAGLPLDGFFVLNPSMPTLHGLYLKGEALILHAVATPYRGRSHFDGQDVLESGLGGVGRSDDGWLNRAIAGLPQRRNANPNGLALGAVVPLVMRGRADVLSWVPKAYNLPLRDATIARLMDLYAATDPKLAKAFADGLAIDTMGAGPGGPRPPSAQGPFREFVEAAEAAARFMSAADGPRVAALGYNGWDTHANEGATRGQLANRLAGLDAAIKAFSDGMGTAWKDTVVLIVTEFGRTARANGTDGTDHGTGMATLVIGGAVKGGRVLADWPGLGEKALFEGRDLAPTRDLRAVLKGLLLEHLGVPAGTLSASVFPDSRALSPTSGLIRTA